MPAKAFRGNAYATDDESEGASSFDPFLYMLLGMASLLGLCAAGYFIHKIRTTPIAVKDSIKTACATIFCSCKRSGANRMLLTNPNSDNGGTGGTEHGYHTIQRS